jgi:hypothetical protein
VRKAIFTIDTFEGEYFEGYTKDEDWNGWACPYFTFDQVQHIVEVHKRHGRWAGYDHDRDRYMFAPNYDNDREAEFYSVIEAEGLKLYPVGAFNWIWEEYVGSAKP